jgi:hypothetical protein
MNTIMLRSIFLTLAMLICTNFLEAFTLINRASRPVAATMFDARRSKMDIDGIIQPGASLSLYVQKDASKSSPGLIFINTRLILSVLGSGTSSSFNMQQFFHAIPLPPKSKRDTPEGKKAYRTYSLEALKYLDREETAFEIHLEGNKLILVPLETKLKVDEEMKSNGEAAVFEEKKTESNMLEKGVTKSTSAPKELIQFSEVEIIPLAPGGPTE